MSSISPSTKSTPGVVENGQPIVEVPTILRESSDSGSTVSTSQSLAPRHHRRLTLESNLASTQIRILHDGRISLRTSERAQRLTKFMQKKVQRRITSGHVQKVEKREYPQEYKTVLGDYAGIPKLNIAIHIVGSRGDVQPFIPIAQILSKPPYSHRVRICTHPVFKDFVEENGVEFFSIGGDPANLMAYMVKNPGLLPGMESLRAGDVGKRRSEMAEILMGAWRSCIEQGNGMRRPASKPTSSSTSVGFSDLPFVADVIIANPPSFAHLHCAEKLGIPVHIIFTMPWSPTTAFPHPLANVEPSNVDSNISNYLSYTMMELLAWQGLSDIINKFRLKTLHLDPISPLWGHMLLARLRVPFTYCWSQELIPKPKDWGPHISISGFSFLPLASSYQPPEDLVKFLEEGPPPVYIGFGSIVIDKPNELTELIFNAVKRAGVRAIVSKGWGGLGEVKVPDGVYLLGNCPHDWLFNHVSCVVHHGGAGTTAIGVAMGKPTIVVPFFGDQPFWGAMIYRAGAGPKPVPFKKMTEETLANSITQALSPEILTAAKAMGQTIAKENPGASAAANHFHEALSIDDMRCSVCPDRVAQWKVKKTKYQLSSLAAAVLLNGNLIKREQLKLVRHRDWYTDEGPEGPTIALVATFAGTISNLVVRTSDYWKGMSKALRKKPQDEEDLQNSLEIRQRSRSLYELSSRIELRPVDGWAPGELEDLAYKLASKETKKKPKKPWSISRTSTARSTKSSRATRTEHGKTYLAAQETKHFASSIIAEGVKAPVTLFYGIANGFHNLPSFLLHDDTVRRRDNITGFGSGVKVAAKEYVFGMYDGISGLATHPYQGAKKRGVKGFGKGVAKGFGGLVLKVGAAQFGLIGYPLKGLERQINKRNSRGLKAKVIAEKIKLGLVDIENSSEEEKKAILRRWESLCKIDGA